MRATSEFSGSLLASRVHLRVRASAAGRLVRLVDPRVARQAMDTARPPDRDGWLTLHLEVQSDAVAVDQLLGLGPDAAVVAPAAVRDRLADIGRALVAHHA